MARIGYARVSTYEQNVELQRDTLREKGCTKIFTDKITGTTFERKELNYNGPHNLHKGRGVDKIY